MNDTTKEGIVVRVGQVWRSLDKREGNRHVKVMLLENGKATVTNCRPNGLEIGAMRTRLSVRRMHKASTGWALVTDVEVT